MANAAVKVLGVLVAVVGSLALLAGLLAAAYGALDENDNQEQLLPDPNRSDFNENLTIYGLVAAGGGFVFLLLGIITAVAGGPRLGPVPPAPATETATPAKRGAWIGVVAVVLVLGFVLTALALQGDGNGAGFAALNGGRDGGQETLLDEVSFDGSVRNAYSTPLQSGTSDATQSRKELTAPEAATRLDVNLSWTPQDTGTDNLRLILEIQDGTDWQELTRADGQGPLTITLQDPGLGGVTLRYRVLANDNASIVVEQDFHIQARFYGIL